MMTSVVLSVVSLIVDSPEVATMLSIWGSIDMVMIGRIRLLNKFCCISPLLVAINFIFFLSLVWVATFGLLAGSPFASSAFAESDSSPAHPKYLASHLLRWCFHSLLVYWADRLSDWNYPQWRHGPPIHLLQWLYLLHLGYSNWKMVHRYNNCNLL